MLLVAVSRREASIRENSEGMPFFSWQWHERQWSVVMRMAALTHGDNMSNSHCRWWQRNWKLQ